MKTKRTTKKKPTANARLRERIIALEVNHESLCETLRALQGRVDALRIELERCNAPRTSAHPTAGSLSAPPEPVIPKGWKRTTKGNAALKDGKYRALYKNSHLGEWHADWHACHDADRFYIYLARDYPELPADVTAAGWVACEWGEATKMGNGRKAGVWMVYDGKVRRTWVDPWASHETDITWVKLEPNK